jgi:gliding motility-associated protein GldM
MASGQLSPRQKMINMMYLVLTALLALNVSSEVLNAFYQVMLKQKASIETIDSQNATVYAAFKAAADDNEAKAGPWRDKALEVKAQSDAIFSSIEAMKSDILAQAGGPDDEDPEKPKKMDDRDVGGNYFINKKNGPALKQDLEKYREFLKGEIDSNTTLKAVLDKTFAFEDQVSDGTAKSWVITQFKDVPLIAVMTYLTAIQGDIRSSESNVIGYLQENINAKDIKITGVKPMVIPKSTFVTQGDNYEAQVLLAAFDETQNPTFIIDGQEISADQISKGVANLSIPARGQGTKKWNGEIRLVTNGETKVYPIEEQSYNVAPPSAVISPTKMMVLYRNVKNPLEISVPGVDPSNIIVRGSGVKRSGSGYEAVVPSNYSSDELTISVSVKDEDGSTRSMGSKTFRVKKIPPAEGGINGKNGIRMSKGKLASARITASYSNFNFDLSASVTSFEIVIPGVGPIKCSGNKLSSTAKAALKRARPGSTIVIRKIEGKTSAGGRTSVTDCSIDLN